MAVLTTKTHFVIWFMLSNVNGITANCKSFTIPPAEEGRACHLQEYTNISVIERHHCTLACVRDNECKATVHDSRQSVCMLFPEPCMLLLSRTDHIYQSFRRPCTKWVANSDAYFGMGSKKLGRAFFGEDLTMGHFYSWRFFGAPPGSANKVENNDFVGLVVDASCRVSWVPYNATTGQPLPTGALIGGFVAATNTPLYVSLLHEYTYGDTYEHFANYDPVARVAWGYRHNYINYTHITGVISDTAIDIMVVEKSSDTT